jgi:hypothetical protein
MECKIVYIFIIYIYLLPEVSSEAGLTEPNDSRKGLSLERMWDLIWASSNDRQFLNSCDFTKRHLRWQALAMVDEIF